MQKILLNGIDILKIYVLQNRLTLFQLKNEQTYLINDFRHYSAEKVKKVCQRGYDLRLLIIEL